MIQLLIEMARMCEGIQNLMNDRSELTVRKIRLEVVELGKQSGELPLVSKR